MKFTWQASVGLQPLIFKWLSRCDGESSGVGRNRNVMRGNTFRAGACSLSSSATSCIRSCLSGSLHTLPRFAHVCSCAISCSVLPALRSEPAAFRADLWDGLTAAGSLACCSPTSFCHSLVCSNRDELLVQL